MANALPNSFPISKYLEWHLGGSLKLRAPFQRKAVWSSRNKSYLIDTILEKLPIPELYIQLKTYNTGKTDHIVVDGQQRIRSILEFIEGKLILDEEESVNHPKCKFQDLSDGERTDFFKYELVTRHLQTDNDKEIQNVFKRLNRYVISLNDQELRNAT